MRQYPPGSAPAVIITKVGPSEELNSIVPRIAGKQENIIDPEGVLEEGKAISALIAKYFKE